MDMLGLVAGFALLAATAGLVIVVESGRRNRSATRKAERKRRELQRQAELRDAKKPGD